jgi:hypothetical protein
MTKDLTENSPMHAPRKPVFGLSLRTAIIVQAVFFGAFAAGWLLLPSRQQAALVARTLQRPVELDVQLATQPAAVIGSLYDDPNVVTEDDLAAVLKKIVPRFSRQHLRPNLIEHALRTWGSTIEFHDDDAISGPYMQQFLTDTAAFVDSWGAGAQPLMESVGDGVHVRWAEDSSSSVHHDHTLAALTEAGLPLDAPVFTANRRLQVRHVLEEALRDFQLDERETEWSALSFALWMAPQANAAPRTASQPQTAWINGEGRRITFDLLADRLMRNHKRDGVCLGTHRVYTLVVLLRLNAEQGGELLSPDVVEAAGRYLRTCRDLIIASQADDGSWPANWTDGADAASKTDPTTPISKRVIATGHHLEWLAIAPEEFHPPREQVRRAADWLVKNIAGTPQSEIDRNYTFYSHVGKALALWRKTSPPEFWLRWRAAHPECEDFEPVSATSTTGAASEH